MNLIVPRRLRSLAQPCPKLTALLIAALFGAATHDVEPQGPPAQLRPALDSLTPAGILSHIKVLASDEFEGRAPGTKGEELTVNYLVGEFKKLGLKPGNPDGTYVQAVPLVGFKGQPEAWFEAGGAKMPMKFPEDFVAVSRRQPVSGTATGTIEVTNSELVFVGYGVVAPEYGWDDYKGVDVRGKTLVMLVNDPQIPDAKDPTKLDEQMFKGKAMTYYGRWTYKYEIASEKGASAAIIVHETGPAGYPYEVVANSWGHENFDIQQADRNANRVAVESWITLERARQLFGASGFDFDALKRDALDKEFKPVALGAKVTFRIKNDYREIQSRNVLGKLEGSDSRLKNEYVIYTAHWDHLGRDTNLKGDQIFNGAVDNASGVSSLLEIARAYTKLGKAPKRSILFLSVTAEEKGLLGSKYYAANPLYPLANTLANINMDGVNQWGKTRDIVDIGLGYSTLDDLLTTLAATQGRVVKPDAESEKGYFYRSDHFEFAKKGVPALDLDSGMDFIGKPKEFGAQKREEFTAHDYHKPSDEIKPDWDLSGAVEDLQLLFQAGYEVAQAKTFPEWKPGTEFKARRDEMLKAPKSKH